MNNTDNIKVGDIVTLDENYRGGSKVKVVRIGLKRVFATIERVDNPNDSWDVLLNRLSVIK